MPLLTILNYGNSSTIKGSLTLELTSEKLMQKKYITWFVCEKFDPR